MKRRFIAIFLAGGLMLGLCGCEGSSDSSLPSETVTEVQVADSESWTAEEKLPEVWYTADDLLEMWSAGTITKEDVTEMAAAGEMNDATFREMINYIEREEEYAVKIEAIRASGEGWSADDLISLYYSGALLREEIVEMTATGEISDETFEEFLARIEWNGEPIAQPEDTLENDSIASNIDTSSLLTTYTIEFEDVDGYQIRETVQLSPIFTKNDTNTMYALWETLGNDIASFPSKESLQNQNRALANYELEYVVGTYMIENLTDGFSITPDNPRGYIRSLVAEGEDTAATFFNNRSVSAIMYSDGIKYYDDIFTVVIGDAKMESDAWGPRTFVIALPNAYTPNQPGGYCYDEIQIRLSYNNHGSYDHSNYDILELEYFE